MPELNQRVVSRAGSVHEGQAFARQVALSIDAAAPSNNGWSYADDDDPSTAPCRMVGKAEWRQPRILIRETATEVRVLAAVRRTAGNRSGCVLGGEHAEWGCPTLTRKLMKLRRPVGERRIVFETFG